MTELLTSAQMRAIERTAIDSGEVTGLELMERAGRGVVEAVFEEWPELARTSHRAVVLCGPGNNGGDGFVVARLLKEWGWEVEVFLYGDPAKLPPDARVNYARWGKIGAVKPLDADAEIFVPAPDLSIDALFGTGLERPLTGPLLDFAQKMIRARPAWRDVAIDIPSGLHSDTGRILGAAFPAELTVSFHARKLGHHLADGSRESGKLVVKSIGIEGTRCPAVPPGDVVTLVEGTSSHFDKPKEAHKYSHGHALVLSGGLGKTGAARLAARGALRIGAGLVTVGSPGDALAENAAQLTAIMLRGVEDATALSETLKDDRITALCLGPGLGLERARDLVPVALAGRGRAVVLDADALTAFTDDPEALFGLLHENCVLTPHAGEFARLFPDIAEKLNATPTKGPAFSKVDATRAAARRAGCVVLFKGPDTVIAAPSGECGLNSAQYDRAAPWLATAGSGDVLAGFITGLLARGLTPMRAAETAAWLHVECALRFGPGLIAEDIPEQLPQVFRDLGL